MVVVVNENELAKVICRAFMEKTFAEMRSDGKVTDSNGPAVNIALNREVNNKWQKFLPEARAVLKAMNGG